MNRLAAILLLFLALFNVAGYRLFFFYMQEKSDRCYISNIDKGEYDESRMLTIKVDLDMPYLPANTEYERVDGEISIEGKVYKYVKRRVHNGQLVLLCLPDDTKTKLHSASREYFANANNIQQTDGSHSSKKATVIKVVVTEYDEQHRYWLPACLATGICHRFAENDFATLTTIIESPAQPPELV